MKKLLLLCLVLLGGVMQVSADDCYLMGSINNWSENDNYKFTQTGSTFTLTVSLTENQSINFKIKLGGIWYGQQNDGGTMTWDNCTDWSLNTGNDGKNINLNAFAAGNYTFIFNSSNSKISVTYPNMETVYFYNNHNWSNVYVYLLGTSYWDAYNGSGSKNRRNGYLMTKIGETNTWKLTYPKSYSSAYIAFVKDKQDGYDKFDNTEAVYREDFNTNTPLYVPNASGADEKNKHDNIWTAYWNTGAWHPFPTYTRSVTSGNYGTICLPFNATVAGADIFTISSKVMDPNDNTKVKYINFTPVEGNTVEAGKAYIFKATSSTLTATLSGNYTDAIAANGMMGNITSATPVAVSSGNLIIKNNMLYEVGTGVTCGQYKGYITPSTINVASARGANFMGFEDTTNGINAIENGQLTIDNDAPIYNLAGQKVTKSYKGVVIVNGKKVVLK